MGGILHPTAKGIVIGRITGLKNSVSIVEYILSIGVKSIEIPEYYTSPGTEYYIGFGTGYELGQKLRIILENDNSNQMSLDKKIEYFSFLLEKQEICRENLIQPYLNNIKFWGQSNIPCSIIEDVQILLNKNKIQRAVDTLFLYYKDNFYLKSLKEFYEIHKKLKDIRKEKKLNKKYNISEELGKIKAELQSWISSIKDKTTTHNK
jgi:hypothetical protein